MSAEVEKKRILIVDDSALMRRLESDIISSDSRYTVAGCLTNGIDAYDTIIKSPTDFDLMLCDINLPRMTGLELLAALRHQKINLKVIIVSSLAKMDSKETIQALQLGAFECIEKPGSFTALMGEDFKKLLLLKISLATHVDIWQSDEVNKKSVAPGISITKTAKPEAGYVSPMNPREILANITVKHKKHVSFPTNAKKLVLIASSTGGPKALQDVIPKFPKNLNAPVLVVQHMAEGFTNSLAQRLDQKSSVHVVEAANGEKITKGTVYVAKGGGQMRLKKVSGDYVIDINMAEPPRSALKPCADILFESIAGMDFDEIVCCIMTGMGGDGTMGVNALAEKNNLYVIAQDEATSTVYGMPKVVHDAGLTDTVKPLDELAQEIINSTGVQNYGC